MRFTLNFDISQTDAMLSELQQKAGGIAARALYEGAGMMADSLTEAIDSIKTEPFRYAKNGEKRLPSPQEKAALKQGRFGVAHFRGSGTEIETSIGMGNAGYAHIMGTGKRSASSRYNKGKDKAVPQIAHAIDSGTSFMQAQPIFKKAFSRNRAAAEAKIAASIDNEIQGIIDAHE